MPPDTLRLDPAGLEQMRENFLAVLTDFGDFGDVPSLYHETERAYKDEAAALVRTHLSPALFAARTAREDVDHDTQVVAAALRVLTARLESVGIPQNIVGWRYVDFLRQMNDDERAGFARAFGELLHGPGQSPARVEAFVQAMWPAWQRTQGGNPYALSRVFPTFFLMLRDPRHDLAARTDLFVRAGRMLLPPSFYLLRNRPFNGEDYRRILGFAQAVQAALHRWGWSPRDMIDIHSFLWVGTRTAADRADASDEADA
jgi:hypothetical protein